MKSDRVLLWLLLSAGVAVTLGLTLATLPAQDIPPLAPGAPQQPTTQPASPAAAPEQLAQSSPPAAPAGPPPAAAPTKPPAGGASANPAAALAAAQPAQAEAAPGSPPPPSPNLTQAQLAELLAPIALYPDQLLGQILMASTYPVEVVEAARWAAEPAHRTLRGQALTNALRQQNWDPSVMALVPFPHILEMMNAQVGWTQKLGAAFLAQQADVMDEVQQLRKQAIAAGNFKSGPQCRCVVSENAGYVTVAPANPEYVCVPVYTPAIYGAWRYPAYPPWVFPVPVGFVFAPGFFIGFGWGVDVAFYGPLWGWGSLFWAGHSILVDPVRYAAISGGRGFAGGAWSHDASRGRGSTTASASGRGSTAAGASGGGASAGGRAGHTAWAGGRAGHAGYAGGRSGHAAYAGGRAGHAAWGGGGHGGGGHAAWGGGGHGGGGHAAIGGGGHGGGGHGGGGHAAMGGGHGGGGHGKG